MTKQLYKLDKTYWGRLICFCSTVFAISALLLFYPPLQHWLHWTWASWCLDMLVYFHIDPQSLAVHVLAGLLGATVLDLFIVVGLKASKKLKRDIGIKPWKLLYYQRVLHGLLLVISALYPLYLLLTSDYSVILIANYDPQIMALFLCFAGAIKACWFISRSKLRDDFAYLTSLQVGVIVVSDIPLFIAGWYGFKVTVLTVLTINCFITAITVFIYWLAWQQWNWIGKQFADYLAPVAVSSVVSSPKVSKHTHQKQDLIMCMFRFLAVTKIISWLLVNMFGPEAFLGSALNFDYRQVVSNIIVCLGLLWVYSGYTLIRLCLIYNRSGAIPALIMPFEPWLIMARFTLPYGSVFMVTYFKNRQRGHRMIMRKLGRAFNHQGIRRAFFRLNGWLVLYWIKRLVIRRVTNLVALSYTLADPLRYLGYENLWTTSPTLEWSKNLVVQHCQIYSPREEVFRLGKWLVGGGAGVLFTSYMGAPVMEYIDDVRVHRDSLQGQEILKRHQTTIVQHPALAEPTEQYQLSAEKLQNLPATAPKDARYGLVTSMQDASHRIYQYSTAHGCETDFSQRPKGSISKQMEYSLEKIHEHAQSRPQPVLPDSVINPSTANQP